MRRTHRSVTPCTQKFDRLGITLETGRVKPIITVSELNYTTDRIPYR